MKREFLFLLFAVLLLLSVGTMACAPKKHQKQKTEEGRVMEPDMEGQKDPAKGRYREDKVAFPVSVKNVFNVLCKDETDVKILAEGQPGSFYFCESHDAGKTWQEKEIKGDWLPECYRVVSACFGTGGSIIVSVGKISEDPLEEQHAVGEYLYFKLDNIESKMQVSQLSLELPKPKEEYLSTGYGLGKIYSSQGNLYGILQSKSNEQITYQVFCFHLENGTVLWKLDFDQKPVEIALFEEQLYLNEYDGKIQELDKETGANLTEVSVALGNMMFDCMDVKQEGEKIFYCDENGIYGTDSGMAFQELLVDGALGSFSDVSYHIKNFYCVNEKIFLMFLADETYTKMELLRYEYDPELAAQPENELVVYSLYSREMVAKLVSDFRSSHPDVFVKYQVGMEDSGCSHVSDAINILNTEILSGNGPDIIILNGLPWEAYQDKKILEDLSSDLKPYFDKNEVFENLFSVYKKDGSQYVAPILFEIPVIVGEGSKISGIDSMGEVLHAVKSEQDLAPLAFIGDYLSYMVSIYWQRIEKEDGSINKEELKQVLEHVKELVGLLQPGENDKMSFSFFDAVDNEEDATAFGGLLDVWNVVHGNTAMSLGYLGSIVDFTALSDHVPGQNLSYQMLPEHVFSSLNAGINSGSNSMEAAKEFLKFALSEKEQKVLLDKINVMDGGFPVNQAAWKSMVAKPSQSELEMYEERFERLGGTFEWQDKETFDRLEYEVSNLSIPAMEDSIILQTIQEGAKPYLLGEKEIGTTVNEIVQALELYQMEGNYE